MKQWKLLLLGIVILGIGVFIGTRIKNSSIEQPSLTEVTPTEIPVNPTISTIITVTPMNKLQNTNTTEMNIYQQSSQSDIVEVVPLVGNVSSSQTGTDVSFSVTLQNVSNNQKLIKKVCFNSDEGNFGCTPSMNVGSQQIFSLNNSTRFSHPGVKSVWVTWSQDNVNYYIPLHAVNAHITVY